MPYSRPTLTALIEQAQTDVASALGLYALLRFSPERALATAQAGLAQGLYGYLDWIAQQAVPFTATAEYLDAWAALVDVHRKAPSPATGSATFTGTNGAVLPLGTTVTNAATGVIYVTTESGTVSGGTVTVPIEATEPGTVGNAAAGAMFVLGTAVMGVNSTGAAATALTGGAELEDDDALRTRMLEAYQKPPQGGAESDYVQWAKEVPGVTRAWVIRNTSGPGTVGVFFMMDNAHADNGGFPVGTNGSATGEDRAATATGDQLAVANHIFPLQPVTALVIAYRPTAYPVNFTIRNINDVALRPLITTALADVIREKAQLGGVMYPSDFLGALKAVPGLTRYSMPVPANPITAPPGRLHTLGTISWE